MRPVYAGRVPGQEVVEVVGEELPVALVERRRAAEDSAGRAQVLHEVAHGETLANVVLRVELSSRIERVRSARDHLGGEGYVGGDHQVPGLDFLHDAVIGDVEALRDPHAPDEG